VSAASASVSTDLDPILELRGIHAGYNGIEAVSGVDLSVLPGEIYALVGPNGAGKSTTVAVAACLHEPTEGDVVLGGRMVNRARPQELCHLGVCLVPEGRSVFPNLTVHENLWLATHAGVSLDDIERRAYDRFPVLGNRRSQLAGTLSGGEQQMLALARAVAVDPALLLVDELSMGLAPVIIAELYGFVREIASAGVTVVLVEQFARTVLGLADRAAVMSNGRIVGAGRPDEVEDILEAAYLGAL
jgi:branched-chain amino acid transport system ATP-binding protein